MADTKPNYQRYQPREEIDLEKELTKTELTAEHMIEQGAFDEIIRDLTAPKPRKGARVKLCISAFVSGRTFFTRVNMMSLSARVMGIDKKISIEHSDKFFVTVATDPPMMLACQPIIGDFEFGRGTWDRLYIRTDFSFEKAIALLSRAVLKKREKRAG